MPLPDRPRATRDVGGITVHGLTRSQVRHMQREWAGLADDDDVSAAEAYLLACGSDDTPEHAAAWIEATDSPVSDAVLSAIRDLTLMPAEGAPDPQPSSSGS